MSCNLKFPRRQISVRQDFKEILKRLEEDPNLEEVEKLLYNEAIYDYNFGLDKFLYILPLIRRLKTINFQRRYDAIKLVINCGFKIKFNGNKYEELYFFAAAKCDVDTVALCLNKFKENDDKNNRVNAIYQGDPVLIFLVKYGELSHQNFLETFQLLLSSGVDPNKRCYENNSLIAYLLMINDKQKKQIKNNMSCENVRKSIELVLDTKLIDISENYNESETIEDAIIRNNLYDLSTYDATPSLINTQDRLFEVLIKGNEKGFINFNKIKNYKNANDGNNTLLQLCCEKNLINAAKHLIKNGANPMETTKANSTTPIEIAATRNHEEIFDVLLNSNNIEITADRFNIFLTNRPKHIKAKYFDKILQFKKLDPNIRSSNGNTPLHYAIIFSNNKAIQILMKNGASLLAENNAGKCPLDYISADDLKLYLDSCILLDNYESDTLSGKYEIALKYPGLVECNESGEIVSEMTVLEKICESDDLRQLVNHPLIISLVEMKWNLVKPFYTKMFQLNILLNVLIITSFLNLHLMKSFGGLLMLIMYSAKTYCFLNWNKNKLHGIVDISICFLLFIILFSSTSVQHILGIITTLMLAFSCHLFWRFNPDFAKFHATIVIVSTQFFSYLTYLIIACFFLAATLRIFQMSQVDGLLPESFIYSTFIMLVGGFLLLMTLINMFLCINENFKDNIKQNSYVIGCKNVTIFLKQVENIYVKFEKARWILPNPFLFDNANNMKSEQQEQQENNGDNKKVQKKLKRKAKNRVECIINCRINLNRFTFDKLLKFKLSFYALEKMRNVINKRSQTVKLNV